MARIELTSAVRRSQEEVLAYLADATNYPAFLKSEGLEEVQAPSPSSVHLKLRAMGRSWPLALEKEPDSGDERLRLRTRTREGALGMTLTWQLRPMRTDRRGARTEVHLAVEVDLPGGPLGRLAEALFMERHLIRTFDPVMRELPELLGGKLRSGLREGAGA